MSIHILIVDDSKAALFMFEKIILLSGIDTGTIRTAENGLEALAVLESFPECSLILTDLNMPEMDGVQFLEKVKENPRTRDIPVIVISSEGRDEFLGRALEKGASASLCKPSKPEQVKAVILQTLGVEEDASKITEPFSGDY